MPRTVMLITHALCARSVCSGRAECGLGSNVAIYSIGAAVRWCDCGHRLSTAVAAQCPAWCAMAVPYVPNAAVFVDRSASQASERNGDSEPSHAVVGQADRSGLGFDDSAKHRCVSEAELLCSVCMLDAVCACCAARLGQLTAGLSLFSLRCPTHELSSHASPTTPARRPAQRRAIENNLASNLALCRILVLQRCSDLHTNAPHARTDTVGH